MKSQIVREKEVSGARLLFCRRRSGSGKATEKKRERDEGKERKKKKEKEEEKGDFICAS